MFEESRAFVNKDLNMSDDRYLAALKRIRASIADGCPLLFCNSDTMGDKYSECSWGLCSDDPQHWPDPEDHVWPDQFVKNGRVAPKYLKKHQFCPMDRRMVAAPGSLDGLAMDQGCFWTCRIFRPKKNPQPTREQVLALYDQAIATVSEAVGGNVSVEGKSAEPNRKDLEKRL